MDAVMQVQVIPASAGDLANPGAVGVRVITVSAEAVRDVILVHERASLTTALRTIPEERP
jgi:hypothetical protein